MGVMLKIFSPVIVAGIWAIAWTFPPAERRSIQDRKRQS